MRVRWILGAALGLTPACGRQSAGTQPVASTAQAPSLQAVQCQLFESVESRAGFVGSEARRSLTVRAEEHGGLTVGALVLRILVQAHGFQVSAHAGEREILRATHELPNCDPAVCYSGQRGFGLIYFSTPGINYQLSCRAVPRSRDPDRASHEAARRERELQARRQAFYSTLYAHDNCLLNHAQRKDGETCTPESPLPARTEALFALHKMGERSFANLHLEGADLAKADLRESHFPAARLAGVKLQAASLYFDNLQGADLRRANLERANLYAADLADANLEGANLRGANLERATLDGAKLAGADLTGAHMAYTKLDGADLSGVELARANLESAKLRGTTLVGANLAQAQLKHSLCDGANLEGARNLTEAQLRQAHGDTFTRLPPGLSITPTNSD